MKNTDREKNADARKYCSDRWKCLKVNVEKDVFTRKYHDIHQPNTLAKRVRKRIENIDSRGDPFCESVFAVLGLAKPGDLFSKDSEDSLGGIAGLKRGKERMRGQVFLRLSFVRFQRSVENGRKVGIRSGSGWFSGHDGEKGRLAGGE